MNIRYAVELILLAALWGSSFLFIRIGSPEFGPFAFIMLRCLIAGLVLLPSMLWSTQRHKLLSHSFQITVVGVIGTAIPFVLFAYAALSLNAGVTSVLNATTAMFTAVIAYFWLRESLARAKICGLIMGFVGVAVLSIDKRAGTNHGGLLAVIASLTASCCYAASATYVKRYLTGVSSLITTGGSQLVAALVLIPLALAYWPQQMPSDKALISLLLLSVFCTALALLFFFRLIENIGPSNTVSVTYLIPVFGLLWGALLLDELVTLNIVLGAVLILVGVGLTTGFIGQLLNPLWRKNA